MRLRLRILQEHSLPTLRCDRWSTNLKLSFSSEKSDATLQGTIENSDVGFVLPNLTTATTAQVLLSGPHGEVIRSDIMEIQPGASELLIGLQLRDIEVRVPLQSIAHAVSASMQVYAVDVRAEGGAAHLSLILGRPVLMAFAAMLPPGLSGLVPRLRLRLDLQIALQAERSVARTDRLVRVRARNVQLSWDTQALVRAVLQPGFDVWRRSIEEKLVKECVETLARHLDGAMFGACASARQGAALTFQQARVEGDLSAVITACLLRELRSPSSTPRGKSLLKALLEDKNGSLSKRRFEGKTAWVYEIVQEDRTIAVKVLREPTPEAVQMLRREFRALRDLHHANLPAVYDLLEGPEGCGITMQFIEGKSFVAHYRERRDDLLSGLQQLVSAVAAIHRAGWVHRDVTPANVRITPDGHVYLLDLGLIAPIDVVPAYPSAGTPRYMAPERAAGLRVTPPDDWYGLGAVLFETLTGAPPPQAMRVSDDAERCIRQSLSRWTARAAMPQTTEDIQLRLAAHKDALRTALGDPPPATAEHGDGTWQDWMLLSRSLLLEDPSLRTGEDILRAWLQMPGLPAELARGMTAVPFFGREDVLAILQGAFAEMAADRRSRFIVLSSAPGLGKSELLRRSRMWLPPNTLVLAAACGGDRELRPYNALSEIVEGLADFLMRLGSRARDLPARDLEPIAHVFPAFRRVLGLRPPPQPGAVGRAKTAESIRSLLGWIQRCRPGMQIVFLMDDLQWSDRDSLLMFDAIFSPEDGPPVLVVGTVSGRMEQIRSSVLAKRGHEIELRELTPPEARLTAAALYEQITGQAPPGHLVEKLVAITCHPLFLGWIVRDHATALAGQSPPEPLAYTTMPEVISRSFHRLGKLEVALLQRVCWAYTPLPLRALTSKDTPIDAWEGAAKRLRSGHWIRFIPDADVALLTPHHAAIRDVVRDMTPPSLRRPIHRMLADSLARSSYSERFSHALVHHLERAGLAQQAAREAHAAADHARSELAFDAAAALYESALSIERGLGEDRWELREKLATVLELRERFWDAAMAYARAAQSAPEAEGVKMLARAAQLYLLNGHLEEGVKVLANVLDKLQAHEPGTLARAKIKAGLALAEMFRLAPGWLTGPRETPDDLAILRADVLTAAAVGFAFVDIVAARRLMERLVVHVYHTGEPVTLRRALLLGEAFAAANDHPTEVIGMLRARVELIQPDPDPSTDAYSLASKGFQQLARSNFVAAEESFRAAEELLSQGFQSTAPLGQVRLGRLFAVRRLGRLLEAYELRKKYLEHAAAVQDQFIAVTLRRGFRLVVLAYEGPRAALEELSSVSWTYPAGEVTNLLGLPPGGAVRSYQDWLRDVSEHEIALFEGSARLLAPDVLRSLQRSAAGDVQFHRAELTWLYGRCAVALAAAWIDQGRLLTEAAYAAAELDGAGEHGRVWADLLRAGHAAARRRREEALRHLHQASSRAKDRGMALCAAAADLRIAQVKRNLRSEAWDEYMSEQSIAEHHRDDLANLVAPGFSGPEWPAAQE